MRKHMRRFAGATALLLVLALVPPWHSRGPWNRQRRRRSLYTPGRRAGGPFQRLSAAIPGERAVLHRHSQSGRDLPGRRPCGSGATQRAGRDADREGEREQRRQKIRSWRIFVRAPHPDGVLRSEVRLDEGLYTVTIATEKQNLMKRPQYLLRVHMTDYQQAGANRGRATARRVARGLARIQAPPLDVAAELVDRPPVLGSRRSAMAEMRGW